MDRDRLTTLAARIIGWALVAFTVWFVLTLLLGGPGTCIWPGGC